MAVSDAGEVFKSYTRDDKKRSVGKPFKLSEDNADVSYVAFYTCSYNVRFR